MILSISRIIFYTFDSPFLCFSSAKYFLLKLQTAIKERVAQWDSISLSESEESCCKSHWCILPGFVGLKIKKILDCESFGKQSKPWNPRRQFFSLFVIQFFKNHNPFFDVNDPPKNEEACHEMMRHNKEICFQITIYMFMFKVILITLIKPNKATQRVHYKTMKKKLWF